MGDQRQQPQGVFFAVMGIVEALRNEKAHNGAGNAPDDVQSNRQGAGGIAGEQQPCNMVCRHRRYGNELQQVGVQPLVRSQLGHLSALLLCASHALQAQSFCVFHYTALPFYLSSR